MTLGQITKQLLELQRSGAKFAVERRARVASGKPVRQTAGWAITEITPTSVSVAKSTPTGAQVKEVMHETFAQWQANWLFAMEKRVGKVGKAAQPQQRSKVRGENGVTPAIEQIHDAWIRHQTGV